MTLARYDTFFGTPLPSLSGAARELSEAAGLLEFARQRLYLCTPLCLYSLLMG